MSATVTQDSPAPVADGAAAFPLTLENARVCVVGLGYVGLPVAVAFGQKFPTVGIDVKADRVARLKEGHDETKEATPEELAAATRLTYTTDMADAADCNVFIVTVPTPLNGHNHPDLGPLESATRAIGKVLKRGDVVIYESTVYPGCTDEFCVPILEQLSGLTYNADFFCGYSPERINPGDKLRKLPDILKITSGSTPEAADFVDAFYGSVVKAGTHRASSIRVAEAAKVMENTQRDLN
ncbi:MAG: nucleotide sugar dehydrogenase, partial [Erythrobacter sp.]|nr:nucleotide sugar dehydrogenase [Erythrobacter sp.]